MQNRIKNVNILIPFDERERVSSFFNLNIIGEEYAKALGDLTDELSELVFDIHEKGEDIVIVPILRAGRSMSDRLSKRLEKAEVAQISMRRNLKTLKPFVAWDEFHEIKNLPSKKIVIADPALATGGSIIKTIDRLVELGVDVSNILTMSMFGCEEGIERIIAKYPKVNIFLVHLADGIREDGYLLPYNGDTGDRLYGVRENEFII